MLYSFLISIQHDCPFAKFSRAHPEVEIHLWCNHSQYDILELQGEPNALENAINDVKKALGSITKIFPEQNHIQLVLKRCECISFPLAPVYERHDCVEILPIKYLGGHEVIHLIVTAEDAGLIVDDIRKNDPLANVEVLKLAPLKAKDNPNPLLLSLDNLKHDLTSKQFKAITYAYKAGYYELPRAVRVDSLADEMNIHRRTFEEHLRKAERKIMRSLIPSLIL
ncbi:MAG: helix-turn-helix domain-containing protein [Candidatus Hodarchaeales archaeon]|jgi:predicted DNA binding protein